MKQQNISSTTFNNPSINIDPISSYSDYIKQLIYSTGTYSPIVVSLGHTQSPFGICSVEKVVFYNEDGWRSPVITKPTWLDAYCMANKCILDTNNFDNLILTEIYDLQDADPVPEHLSTSLLHLVFTFK